MTGCCCWASSATGALSPRSIPSSACATTSPSPAMRCSPMRCKVVARPMWASRCAICGWRKKMPTTVAPRPPVRCMRALITDADVWRRPAWRRKTTARRRPAMRSPSWPPRRQTRWRRCLPRPPNIWPGRAGRERKELALLALIRMAASDPMQRPRRSKAAGAPSSTARSATGPGPWPASGGLQARPMPTPISTRSAATKTERRPAGLKTRAASR